MTKNNQTANETGKFTNEKQWKYRKIINPITSEIQAALILYKLKTGNNWQADTPQISYDEDWKISESRRKDAPKKWAVDILWNIEDINILNIRDEAYKKIDESKIIEEDDKEQLKTWIRDFIAKAFITPRSDLEEKKHLPHKKFRRYYTQYAQSLVKEKKLSPKQWIL